MLTPSFSMGLFAGGERRRRRVARGKFVQRLKWKTRRVQPVSKPAQLEARESERSVAYHGQLVWRGQGDFRAAIAELVLCRANPFHNRRVGSQKGLTAAHHVNLLQVLPLNDAFGIELPAVVN